MKKESRRPKAAFPKQAIPLTALCWLVYFSAYLARNDYPAALAPMMESLHLGETSLSWAGTGTYLTYGAGQLLAGWLTNKMAAKRLIFFGLFVSALCNGRHGAVLKPIADDVDLVPERLGAGDALAVDGAASFPCSAA